eukprot:CAMPEP_0114285548 /NCGR_PEP_ID=MMETSP0059-20121206/5249_1 /TAXON_ID=36894 /ORGANISM="Pyramimonas parkeae, Strain CCMP726" /LENGTH=362 /DNA_ID=CAMNT_0001406461 /DNA_START=544 /DNA_END=1632 /DNA_ORIENTATION=-
MVAFDTSVPLSSLLGMPSGNEIPLAPTNLGCEISRTDDISALPVAAVSTKPEFDEKGSEPKVHREQIQKGGPANGSADASKNPANARKRKAVTPSPPIKATMSMQDQHSNKKRKKKDKDAPKKPRSAYIVFLDRHREEIRKACPEMMMKNITSALAKQWQHVTEDEMKLCRDIAAEERQAYENRKKEYEEQKALKPPEPAVADVKLKARRAKKDKDAPKKGRSAFILFLMEYRVQNKQQNNSSSAFADVSKSVGKAWADLPAELKAPYLEKATSEKAQYEELKKVYLDQKQARILAGEPIVSRAKKQKKAKVPLDINMDNVPLVSGVDPFSAPRASQPPPDVSAALDGSVISMSDALKVLAE